MKNLDKANSSTMNVKRNFLCVEIYKTINNLNSSFMKQIFELREKSFNSYEIEMFVKNTGSI